MQCYSDLHNVCALQHYLNAGIYVGDRSTKYFAWRRGEPSVFGM